MTAEPQPIAAVDHRPHQDETLSVGITSNGGAGTLIAATRLREPGGRVIQGHHDWLLEIPALGQPAPWSTAHLAIRNATRDEAELFVARLAVLLGAEPTGTVTTEEAPF